MPITCKYFIAIYLLIIKCY